MNELDRSLMLALNFDGGQAMDAVMWFSSVIASWIPLYLAVLGVVWYRYGWKYMLFTLLFIGAGVGICDQVCNFFKHNVEYFRPTHTDLLPDLHTMRGLLGGTMGTVSGHASTSMCIFLLSSLVVSRKWFTAVMFVYMLLTSYSRIYLGLHFPFQILFGWTLGIVVALALWQIMRRLDQRYGWSAAAAGA